MGRPHFPEEDAIISRRKIHRGFRWAIQILAAFRRNGSRKNSQNGHAVKSAETTVDTLSRTLQSRTVAGKRQGRILQGVSRETI